MGSVASIGSYEVNGVNGVSRANGLLGSYGVMRIIRNFGIGRVTEVMRAIGVNAAMWDHWGYKDHVMSLKSLAQGVTGVSGANGVIAGQKGLGFQAITKLLDEPALCFL